MKTLAAGSAVALLSPTREAHAAGSHLSWQHFPSNEAGFFRAPVLITGPTEAVLIDGGFDYTDGRALAEAIHSAGKRLTSIYVSQSDPDYYFGLGPVVAAFPKARVLAAPATLAAIQGNVEKKLAVWGPTLKENGPQSLADVVIPTRYDEQRLAVNGHSIDIVDAEINLANRRYLWVPSLRAVFGGVLVFSGVHVWTADTPNPEARAAWIRALAAIEARAPSIVVPGHVAPSGPMGIEAVRYTRDYLIAFEEERLKAHHSAELISAMKGRYPTLLGGGSLEIGAKVALGEMKWG